MNPLKKYFSVQNNFVVYLTSEALYKSDIKYFFLLIRLFQAKIHNSSQQKLDQRVVILTLEWRMALG